MLIIKGYYFFFAAFIYFLVAITDAVGFLKNLTLDRPFKTKLPHHNLPVIHRLHLGKL